MAVGYGGVVICSERVSGSMIKRERSSMINRKKCHGDPDLERKHHLCSIKERKSSMIKVMEILEVKYHLCSIVFSVSMIRSSMINTSPSFHDTKK